MISMKIDKFMLRTYHKNKPFICQIIATSHDLGPQMVVKSKENLLFQGNLGWLKIMIWPDLCKYIVRPIGSYGKLTFFDASARPIREIMES